MKFKFILPSLTEAESPFFRPIKYSLFPPLGLATLAGFLGPDDEAEVIDQHVQKLTTDDAPDVVAIQVYITNAYRAYRIADVYRDFYKWSCIMKGSLFHGSSKHQLKHFFYTSGWKKFEPLWNMMIQLKRLGLMTPMLEGVLSRVTKERGVNVTKPTLLPDVLAEG